MRLFFLKKKKNGGRGGKQLCDPLKQRRSKQLHVRESCNAYYGDQDKIMSLVLGSIAADWLHSVCLMISFHGIVRLLTCFSSPPCCCCFAGSNDVSATVTAGVEGNAAQL